MKDLLTVLLWVGGIGAVCVIVLGVMNKAVIYMDGEDLGMNILPVPALGVGLLIAYSMTDGGFMQNLLTIASIGICVVLLGINFYRSLQHNSVLPIAGNVFVAIVKTLFSAVTVVLALSWIGTILDSKSTWREAGVASIFLTLAASLVGRLVNGSDVYAQRGLVTAEAES